ncbi:Tetratricopeptide repeat-containing protein [Thermoflexibacter ruber]|uniref:histidine kinase n=1 Tax=Thermoflexibacter ruber TaxID=1003 RepID=A0A1I2HT17_9BACT|nr:Tetratricopeptide repeat-containing protein [Thermoflexibacter ruber]
MLFAKKFYIFFVIFSIVLTSYCAAQNLALIDSLEKQLNLPIHDTIKGQVLVNLARELYAFDPPRATQYAKQGIEWSRKIKYAWGEAMSINYLGLMAYFRGDNVEATDLHLSALKIAEKEQLQDVIGFTFIRLGTINKDEGNYDKAKEYYTQAIAHLRAINHALYLSYALNQMGLFLNIQGKYEEALAHFQEALAISKGIKDERHIAVCLYYIAEVYLKKGDDDTALSYYKESFQFNKKINNLLLYASTMNNIAKIYLNKNQIEEAIIHSRVALKKAQQVNLKHEIEGAYHNLYLAYLKKNLTDSTLKYQTLWIAVKDSIFNEQKNRQIIQLQNTYAQEKQRIEIEKQKVELATRNIIIYALGSIFILLSLMAFILYRNNLIKHRNNLRLQKQKEEILQQKRHIEEQNANLQLLNEEITQQKEEIESLNNHLEDLIEHRTLELKKAVDELSKQNQDLQQFSYIVSHNLRSPVARILGLVNILDYKQIKDEYNQQVLSHLSDVSNSLDTIIKDLTQVIAIRNSLDKTKETVNLEEITHLVLHHLSNEIESTDACLKINFLQAKEILFIKAYAQSIIYNLISNAIKYRSHKRKPLIEICTYVSDPYIILAVKDNGIGIDLKNVGTYKIFGLYQRIATHIEGKGIGLYLTKTQVETLGGKIEVESEPDKGSTFRVFFPSAIQNN